MSNQAQLWKDEPAQRCFYRVMLGRGSKHALIRNRFSGARAPARLPVRVRTQTG